MFSDEFLAKVEAARKSKTCPYCGIGNRLMEATWTGTECDGIMVTACVDLHACARRMNHGPLPWDSDYKEKE